MTERQQAKVQAGQVTYELHTLGWKAFQDLCATIVADIWGQTIQTFFDSHDGGRDGAFNGTWTPSSGESFSGSFTVQCKFTAESGKSLRLTDIKDELPKATRLAARGLAHNYILFTNARLMGTAEGEINAAFEAIPGIHRFAAYGPERISQFIRESPRLRMLVPRVYGLGDLSQILDQRACDQAKEILSALGDDLAKFVITDAYRRSAKAIVEHGFVLLLGEPACGKSMIAAALSLGALGEWGCSTFKIRDADELVRHSNPHEPKQFFWVDDAFGATQFDWQTAAQWNRTFPHINAAIRRGARVLFTSRDYIYRAARHQLKESALPILKESQVVIRVEDLSRREREQILYNHIRLGAQPQAIKTRLKPLLPNVAAHDEFSPEIARRLGNPLLTRNLSISRTAIEQFVEKPVEFLTEILRTIDAASRCAIALVFVRGGSVQSPVDLTPEECTMIAKLGGSADKLPAALEALDGSLLLLVLSDGLYHWRFKHPTIRDAFAVLVAENPEWMDIYLSGTPLNAVFREVSCGQVDLEGVKLVIPPDRFDRVIARLKTFDTSTWQQEDSLYHFFAYRCCREFLELFLTASPEFISNLRVGSYLGAVSDISVLVRLHELGLLPAEKRHAVVSAIRDLAVETPDADFLLDRIRSLLTATELSEILEHVRLSLVQNLDEQITDWRARYSPYDEPDPEGHFNPFVDALRSYRAAFEEIATEEAEAAVDRINQALVEIESAIEELRSEEPRERDDEDFHGQRSAKNIDEETRSVFDDVDL